MKRQIIHIGFGILALLVSTGCSSQKSYGPVVATAPDGAVVVTQKPPAAKEEVVGVSPGTDYEHVRGYWLNTKDGRWVWVSGHYERRPDPGTAWVQGHWDNTSSGWVWTPGRWE